MKSVTTMFAADAKPMSLSKIRAHAAERQFTGDELDWSSHVEPNTWFMCPTLTPLYYTASYGLLTAEQQLRYNRLAGLYTTEIVGMFERMLHPIFKRLLGSNSLPADLREALPGFIADEERHADIWWRLNRLFEPRWYEGKEFHLVRMPRLARMMTRALVGNPVQFPVAVWTVLALEEHSIEISRRLVRANVTIEPRIREAYRLHARDEIRHVHIDWQVLDVLWDRLGPIGREVNMRLFHVVIRKFLLRPVQGTKRVLHQLQAEFPELTPRVPAMLKELSQLEHSPPYREMIFSPSSNPITFRLINRTHEGKRIFTHLTKPTTS